MGYFLYNRGSNYQRRLFVFRPEFIICPTVLQHAWWFIYLQEFKCASSKLWLTRLTVGLQEYNFWMFLISWSLEFSSWDSLHSGRGCASWDIQTNSLSLKCALYVLCFLEVCKTYSVVMWWSNTLKGTNATCKKSGSSHPLGIYFF